MKLNDIYLAITLLSSFVTGSNVLAQPLIGGTWEVVRHQSIVNGETRTNYEKGNESSLWNLSNILIEFNNGGVCNITDMYGRNGRCSWSLSEDSLTINGIKTAIEFTSQNEYITKHPYEFLGLDGNIETATIIITTRKASSVTTTDESKEISRNANLKVYPDPASTVLKVELSTEIYSNPNGRIEVFSMIGQKVISKEVAVLRDEEKWSTTLDISDLDEGAYTLFFSLGANHYSKKFIKN